MLTQEHIETALDFLAQADHEFGVGDVLQGSAKMWGAASHAVMAAAQQKGWRFGDHRSLKVAVTRLAEEYDDPTLESAFGVAEKFHANSYHAFMQDYEFDRDRPTVRRFVGQVKALVARG